VLTVLAIGIGKGGPSAPEDGPAPQPAAKPVATQPAAEATEPDVGGLIRSLAGGHNDGKARAAYGRLVGIGKPAIPQLVKGLKDPVRNVRWLCVQALGAIGGRDVLPGLLAALADEDKDVRRYAVSFLGQWGAEDKAAVGALKKALRDRDAEVVFHAVVQLDRLGNAELKRDHRLIDALCAKLADPDKRQRSHAAEALGYIGSDRAVPALLRGFAEPGLYVRNALVKIGSRKTVPPLLAMLADDNAKRDVREKAALTLRELGDRRVNAAAVALLKSSEAWLRRAGVTALGFRGNRDAVAPLAEIAADARDDSTVRRAAAESLGRIGDTKAVDALTKALAATEAYVRRAAAQALGKVKSPQAVPALIKALKDPNTQVAMSSAYSLGRIGDTRAADTLVKSFDRDDALVGMAASVHFANLATVCHHALVAITGREITPKKIDMIRGRDQLNGVRAAWRKALDPAKPTKPAAAAATLEALERSASPPEDYAVVPAGDIRKPRPRPTNQDGWYGGTTLRGRKVQVRVKPHALRLLSTEGKVLAQLDADGYQLVYDVDTRELFGLRKGREFKGLDENLKVAETFRTILRGRTHVVVNERTGPIVVKYGVKKMHGHYERGGEGSPPSDERNPPPGYAVYDAKGRVLQAESEKSGWHVEKFYPTCMTTVTRVDGRALYRIVSYDGKHSWSPKDQAAGTGRPSIISSAQSLFVICWYRAAGERDNVRMAALDSKLRPVHGTAVMKGASRAALLGSRLAVAGHRGGTVRWVIHDLPGKTASTPRSATGPDRMRVVGVGFKSFPDNDRRILMVVQWYTQQPTEKRISQPFVLDSRDGKVVWTGPVFPGSGRWGSQIRPAPGKGVGLRFPIDADRWGAIAPAAVGRDGAADGPAPRASPTSRPARFEIRGDKPVTCVVDVTTGKVVHRLGTGKSSGYTGQFSPDGMYLAIGGSEWLEVYRTRGWKLLYDIKVGGVGFPLAFSPDSRKLAWSGGSADADVRLLDLRTGKTVRRLKLPKGRLRVLKFSPDGKLLVGGAYSRPRIYVWNAVTGRQTETITRPKGSIVDLAISPDGKTMTVATTVVRSATVEMGEMRGKRTWTKVAAFYGLLRPSIAYAPDGSTLVIGGRGIPLSFHDPNTGRRRKTPNSLARITGRFRLTPDGKRVVILEYDRMHLFDTTTGQLVSIWFFRGKCRPSSVALSPDGSRAVITQKLPIRYD